MALTITATALLLRHSLLRDSLSRTEKLGRTIMSSLGSMMLAHDPGAIQQTLESLTQGDESIAKAFILDKTGRIAYSSVPTDIGTTIDPLQDPSCRVCHKQRGLAPLDRASAVVSLDHRAQRSVTSIYNRESCQTCHPASDRVIGKLIIDHSLRDMYALIASVELLILGSGIGSLFLLVALVMRGINKYVGVITLRNAELSSLYALLERLSRTIDIDELKQVIVDILHETLDAAEVDFIFPAEGDSYRCLAWTRETGKLERKKVDPAGPLGQVVQRWLADGLPAAELAAGDMEARMPLAKGETRLGLLVVRKREQPFGAEHLRLIRAMCGHISLALENARLYRIATSDELTGAFTRRHFNYVISQRFAFATPEAEPLTLLFMDVDDFKVVNDTFGHVVGDTVLRAVAHAAMNCLRDGDRVFRYGGEEFAILLPATDAFQARQAADRVRDAIASAKFDGPASWARITVSVGLASCPENARTAADLLAEADKALYQAKMAGKNAVVVSQHRAGVSGPAQ